jgi:hypothetical protein
MNDCISLYEVLIKFNDFIFNKFKLNIHNSVTLPSLTFNIFRSNYLANIIKSGYNIPLIDGQIYSDLKRSYTGGGVDMFFPSNLYDEDGNKIESPNKVYGYDCNSLYPTVMSKGFDMPVISNQNNYLI